MTPEERIKLERARYVRMRYDMCLARHECVTCRRVDERTLSGRTRCAACNARAYSHQKPRTEAGREADVQRKRDRREERMRLHQCLDCGGQDYLTLKGKPFCAQCQRRRNAHREAYREGGAMAERARQRRDARRAAGLCTKCGKNRAEAGHRQCMDCLVKERLYRRRRRSGGTQAR